ncbi:pyridoxamine 5'-phosphate oxidase family protein [Aureimonas sp. AU4]|uniref:pyridoxamine 5'-phosphate oxidase family protein n=1 Tax=Aureimonas sp. AU4 TaxID=1638163 RepID=UPI0007840105|nr:pyridoxamine 5'-phosphate oxidase family protein [Aureimonas sp. AU4]
MAKQFERIEDSHLAFIERQHIFFFGSAVGDSRVNISPRSTQHFHVLGDLTVAYLDLTGSGSETAAHSMAGGRATAMFCAFEGPPLILRLYGRARVDFRGSPAYEAFLGERYASGEPLGARQVVTLDIDLVQTSCGFAVPTFEHTGERPVLDNWAEKKGEEGLRAYRQEKNLTSIDGLPTGFVEA